MEWGGILGDPKFSRRLYDKPTHPWRAARIESEFKVQKKYGLKSKRELWKAQSHLRRFRFQARQLQARLRLQDAQAEMETKTLLSRLVRLGILPEGAVSIDDVLGLSVEDLLKRRLQTLMFTRGLAHTAGQARQWIVHGHVSVDGRRVTIPGLLVPRQLEQTISFAQRSPLTSDMHPMRRREEEEPRMPPAEEPKIEEEAPEAAGPAKAVVPEAAVPEANK